MEEVFQLDSVTLKETVWRITPAFPYNAWISELSNDSFMPNHTVPWHWHESVEIFHIRAGALEYGVPGKTMAFEEGEAGFVNVNVLHTVRRLNEGEMIQEEHQFLPSFISSSPGSAIEANYVRPVLRKSGLDIVKFPPESGAVGLMQRAYALNQSAERGYELRLRALMSELWLIVCDLAEDIEDVREGPNPDDQRLKQMINYINAHYAERVAQEDIARAGLVGERECFRIFRRNLNMTPGEYLLECRLNHACELLRTTDMPVLDVALSCGFSGASYFGKVFRQRLDKTPREYRMGA